MTVAGKRIGFALTQPFEKVLSITVDFEGSPMKAAGRNRFLDYWEKVV